MHPTGGQSPTMSANDDEEAVDVFGDDGDTPTATADATPAQSAGAPGAAGRAAAAAAAAAPHDAAGAERTSAAARSSDTHTSGAGDGAHAAAAASNTVLSVAVNPTASAAAAAADSQGSSRSGSSTVSSQRKSDHAKPPRAQVAAAAAEAAPVAALQPPHHAGAAVANPDWEIDAEDAETQDVSAGIGAHAAQSAAAGNGQDDVDEDEDEVEVEDRDVLGGGVDDALAPRSANAHAGHKETEQDEGDGNDEEEDIDITDGDDGQPKARAAAAPAPAATAEDDEEIDVGGVEDIAAASTAMQEDGKEGGEEGDEDEDDIDIVGNGSPAPASAASRKGASLPSAPAHGSGNQEGGGDDDDVDVLNGASPPPAANPRTELRQQPDTPTSLAKRMRLTSQPKSAKAAPLPCQVAFLMVGLPGSGKSTLRNLIVESFEANGDGDKVAVVSQDILKKKEKCLELASRSLQEGKNIIIDRCNHNPAQREPFLDICKRHKCGIIFVCLATPPKACIERCSKRIGHEGNVTKKNAPVIVSKILKEFKIVTEEEKAFGRMVIIKPSNTPAESFVILQKAYRAVINHGSDAAASASAAKPLSLHQPMSKPSATSPKKPFDSSAPQASARAAVVSNTSRKDDDDDDDVDVMGSVSDEEVATKKAAARASPDMAITGGADEDEEDVDIVGDAAPEKKRQPSSGVGDGDEEDGAVDILGDNDAQEPVVSPPAKKSKPKTSSNTPTKSKVQQTARKQTRTASLPRLSPPSVVDFGSEADAANDDSDTAAQPAAHRSKVRTLTKKSPRKRRMDDSRFDSNGEDEEDEEEDKITRFAPAGKGSQSSNMVPASSKRKEQDKEQAKHAASRRSQPDDLPPDIEPALPSSAWACPTCTFFNEKPLALACEICGSIRPHDPSKQLCPFCGESVDKEDMDDHIATYHDDGSGTTTRGRKRQPARKSKTLVLSRGFNEDETVSLDEDTDDNTMPHYRKRHHGSGSGYDVGPEQTFRAPHKIPKKSTTSNASTYSADSAASRSSSAKKTKPKPVVRYPEGARASSGSPPGAAAAASKSSAARKATATLPARSVDQAADESNEELSLALWLVPERDTEFRHALDQIQTRLKSELGGAAKATVHLPHIALTPFFTVEEKDIDRVAMIVDDIVEGLSSMGNKKYLPTYQGVAGKEAKGIVKIAARIKFALGKQMISDLMEECSDLGIKPRAANFIMLANEAPIKQQDKLVRLCTSIIGNKQPGAWRLTLNTRRGTASAFSPESLHKIRIRKSWMLPEP